MVRRSLCRLHHSLKRKRMLQLLSEYKQRLECSWGDVPSKPTARAGTRTAVTRTAVTRTAVTRAVVTRTAVTRAAVTRAAVTRAADLIRRGSRCCGRRPAAGAPAQLLTSGALRRSVRRLEPWASQAPKARRCLRDSLAWMGIR